MLCIIIRAKVLYHIFCVHVKACWSEIVAVASRGKEAHNIYTYNHHATNLDIYCNYFFKCLQRGMGRPPTICISTRATGPFLDFFEFSVYQPVGWELGRYLLPLLVAFAAASRNLYFPRLALPETPMRQP